MAPGSPPQQARHLSCDADLTPILAQPPRRRRWTWDGRNASPRHTSAGPSTVRDEHCIFAGCYAPHYWCDVHHVVHWIDHGETSVDNSALLCERHHTKVHHGFTIERDPQGRWHTYRPDGTEILLHRCASERRDRVTGCWGGPVEDVENSAQLELLRALAGTGRPDGAHPLLPGEVIRGEATFEWLDGERFLIGGTHFEHARDPDAITVTGGAVPRPTTSCRCTTSTRAASTGSTGCA